jgi:pimeloyl-ACP methyl ester carboxylesterase
MRSIAAVPASSRIRRVDVALPMLMRWIRYLALGLLGLVALVLLVGAAYEANGHRTASRDFPPRGRLIDIGGRRIQLDCRGTGSPTVVFESGMGIDGSLTWARVHDSVAATTRACAYSRAGVMWSDPRPGPRLGRDVAEDLHAALHAAGEAVPLVLVGHSVGGPYVVAYTERYGADVAGIVFVDASHPDQVARMREVTSMTVADAVRPLKVAAALRWTGLVRMLSASPSSADHAPPEVRRAKAAYASTSLAGMLGEADGLDSTFAQTASWHQLGDRPLFVLTAGAPPTEAELTSMKMTPAQGARRAEIWTALQADEATWSTRSRHTIVPDATHYIQFDRPDVVIAAVRSVVDSVRVRRK